MYCVSQQAAAAPSKAAVKKTPKKAARMESAAAGPKVKRAKNAFMFFSADSRAALKGEPADTLMADQGLVVQLSWQQQLDNCQIPSTLSALCSSLDVSRE